MTLRPGWLASLVAALTIATIGMAHWQRERSNAVMREQLLAQAEQRSVQLADAMAGQVDGLLARIDQVLLQLRRDWDGDPARFDARARAALATLPADAVSHVSVVAADGHTAYNSLNPAERVYVGDRQHFLAHRSGGDRLVVGAPVQSRLARSAWTIVVGRPLLREGRFAGAVNVSVSTSYLSDKLAAVELSPRDVVAMIDADGRFLARSRGRDEAMGQSVPAARPYVADKAALHGVYRTAGSVDGVLRIYAWRRLEGADIVTVIGLAEDSVLAPLEQAGRSVDALGAALLALLALTGGGVAALLVVVARKQAAVEASEAFRRRVFDGSDVAIVVVDEQARIVDCNRAAALLYGHAAPPDVVGRHLRDLSPQFQPDGVASAERGAAVMGQALQTDRAVFDWRHVRPDGTPWDAEVRATSFESDGRRLLHCIVQDVTERRREQQALRAVEARYALAARIGRSAAWEIWPLERRILFDANLPRLMGYGERDLSEDLADWARTIPEPDRQRAAVAMRDVIEGRSDHYTIEHRVVRKDGTIGWVYVQGERVSAPGEPLQLVGSTVDISERKQVETALQLAQFAIDNSRDEVVSIDDEGLVVRYNKQFASNLGMSPEELARLHVWDFDPVFGPERVASVREQLKRDGWARFESRHRRKDGSEYPVDVVATRIRHDGSGYTVAFARDITERKQAERQLLRMNEELEQRVQQRTAELLNAKTEAERASGAKSEFLSRMSHELRTPLNAILGFGQLLALEARDERSTMQLREILHAGRHLLELINEVLDLARVESGALPVSPEPVALRPLVDECLSLLQPQARARGVRLPDAATCDLLVRADRTRLKQVLLNLLSNAVKYNRAGGAVAIDCAVERDARGAQLLRIGVRDDGPGLTAEQCARLFVPFERLDADERHIEGTGIGLALSKRLVELMGGTIGVDSAPGAGSTFWVRLPQGDAAPAPASAAPPSAPEAARSDPNAGARRAVLCIEDNPANLRLIESVFAHHPDVRLLTAIAPGLGLELARTRRPALILLDINLPDMDGYAVMQCLREHPATRDIPVVAVSANAMASDLERGRAAGFAAYLTKPLDIDRLLREVERLLAAHQGA